MPPALRSLMLLQGRGLLRRGLRQARTPRGAAFFGIGVVVFVLWLLPAVVAANALDRSAPEHVRHILPLILCGITLLTALTSAGEKAIAFTGGEVDLLFPGPFTRRQLLLFKLAKGAVVTFLSALVISVAILRHSTHWVAGYVGCALALLFVQLAGTAALLAGQAVGERARARGKLVALAVIVALVIGALHAAGGPHVLDALLADPQDVIQRFAATAPGRVLLAPFYVLSRVMTATELWPELPLWAGAALAMNLAMVGVILAFDAGFVEAAAGASERRYERIRRARSGGALAVAAGPAAGGDDGRGGAGKRLRGRRPLPMLPRLGGAGPVAWRQLTHARRAGRGLLMVLLILATAVGPLLVVAARLNRPEAVVIPILAAVGWISVLLASVLRFDFRADLDAIETLKALPLSPRAVAAGQLVAPTLVMTLIHWIVVAATLAATAGRPMGPEVRGPMLIAAVLALPFNALMFAAENLIFLLAPTRPTAGGVGDFSLFGRQIFTLVIRTAVVGLGATVAAAAAAGAYFAVLQVATRETAVAAGTATAFVVLAAETAAAVPLVALAYRRFDPSVHMPG